MGAATGLVAATAMLDITFNTVFLIYDYCVSVTIIAGVCKTIHRELGGEMGAGKAPERGRGEGFAQAGC